MERNREVRKASIVGSNGFSRRRHRTSMLRDSPDEGVRVELQESVRLRDRTKKDRGRERERERERERGLRERLSMSKRTRGERSLSNRDDTGGDETSDESLNDDVYEDDEDATTTRLIPASVAVSSHSIHSSISQQYSSNNTNSVISSNHHLQHRKSFPPAASSSSKVLRAAPIWKPDEIIGVTFPRKARSASTKRSHDWTSTSSNNYSGGGGEQVHRQASTSPARQGGVSTSTPSPAAPVSPPSFSNAPFRKKVRTGGSNGVQKLKPPKAAAKQSSSDPEELEIEIAEVLYGLKTQSQIPSSEKDDSREVDGSNGDVKRYNSSPISNSNSANKQILGPNSSPLQPVASKRRRLRQMPENSSYSGSAKLDMGTKAKSEISSPSPNLEKNSASNSESVSELGGSSTSQWPQPAAPPPEPTAVESVKMNLELKAAVGGLRETRGSAMKEEMGLPKDKKSNAMRNQDIICIDTTLTAVASASSTLIKANALISDVENQREQKLEIDLMAPPPQVRSSPEREIKIHSRATTTTADQKSSLSIGFTELKLDVLKDKVDEKRKISENAAAEAIKEEWTVQEAGSKKDIENKGSSVVDVQLDLEKPVRNAAVNSSGNKLLLYNDKQQQQEKPFKANREELLTEKSSQSKSPLPLPVPMTSWPGGLPPMGYIAPLQGVVSMDGSTVAPAPIQPLFSQPRPKRCATHSYIARSIHCLQQVMKMNPFWQATAGSASLFGPKPGNLNLMHADVHASMAGRGINNASDKGNDLASNPHHSGRDKGSQTAGTSDSGQRKQQVLIQQPLSPVPAANLIEPAFLFPLKQQQAAVAAVSTRPSSSKSASVGGCTATPDPYASAGPGASVANAMSFSYPAMAANGAQYLAILQNNAYPFPIPAVGGAPPSYRGNPALFNGSFYSSQMIHPSQFQHQQTPSVQSSQLQQAHSNSSSSSQRHLLSQQQRSQSSANGGAGTVNSRDFPGPNSQNFLMPIHPHNFTLMTPPTALAGASPASGSRSRNEKQQQQSLSQNGFALTFGTMNGATTGPGIDITPMGQNHATQMIAATPAASQAAQKKHFRVSEDDRSAGAGDSVTSDAERKSSSAKAQGSVGQSIAFSTSAVGAMNMPNNHIQGQLQQQHLATVALNRSKVQGASNGSLFSELNSSSVMAAEVPAGFAQNFVNSSISTSQSPQWRSSTRTLGSQASSSLASSGLATTKSLSQQHSPSPGSAQMQTQISYGGNPKPSSSQGLAPPSSNRTPSPPVMVGSPSTSSISRGGGGSPRTISSGSANNIMGQNSSLSAQTLKNSSSISNQKSPSILGLPHATSSSSSGAKHPQQKQSQPQLQQPPPPMTVQQAQLFFSNPHSHAQSAHLTSMSSTNSGPGGFYMQRKRADQQQQPAQQSSVVPPTSSTAILTMSPSAALTAMNDPAKANKGGGLPSQGITNAGAILPASFPYPCPVPAVVQVKPAEQKQPAG